MALNARFFAKVLLTSSTLFSAAIFSTCAYAEKIKAIEVDGNVRVEKSSITNYLLLKSDMEYSPDLEEGSIKQLYDTNLFDEIKIYFSKGVLHVHVRETPLVTKVSIVGNGRIKTGTITKELLTHKGASLNKANIKTDIDRIKELYRKSGRYAVNVTAKLESKNNNKTTVIFEISEGPKTKVRYINFIGNRKYKDSELKSLMITKEAAWFRFMDTSDTYDPEKVEYDKFLIKRFYNSVGYADFKVTSTLAEVSKSKDYFTLTYVVEEGEKYNFGDISIESLVKGVDAEQFNKMITVKKGRLYNGTLLEKISESINDKLADMGYAGAVIEPQESKDQENKSVNVKFVIMKASLAHINKININGNLKTRDNVIRRQLKINEGDQFNRSSIQKGEQQLRNLDYFETVRTEIQPSYKGQNNLDVNINVEEKSTADVQLQVGYDTMKGPVGKINFLERNLLGTGRYLSMGVEKYQKSSSENIGLTDPYFMDMDLLAGVSYYHADANGDSHAPYTSSTDAGNLRLGYEVATDLRHDIVYTLKNEKLKALKNRNTSIYISEQFGQITTSSIANSLTYDQTDSAIIPKNGYVVSATETVAGVGGETKFLKHEADVKAFKSFWENNYTFKVSGEVGKIEGYGGKKIRINDRFSLGDYTMRGFEASGVGPRDKRTEEALGGQNYYKITTELEFPLGFPKEFGITGAVFSDIGALWGFDVQDSSIYAKQNIYDTTAPRISYGAGIIWNTRIAPIRIDYAVPIKKEKYDQVQRWHFRLSTSF